MSTLQYNNGSQAYYDEHFLSGLSSYAAGTDYIASTGAYLGCAPFRRPSGQGVLIGCADGWSAANNTPDPIFSPQFQVTGTDGENYSVEVVIVVACLDFLKLPESSDGKYAELLFEIYSSAVFSGHGPTLPKYLLHPGDGWITLRQRYGATIDNTLTSDFAFILGNASNTTEAAATSGPYPALMSWDVQLL